MEEKQLLTRIEAHLSSIRKMLAFFTFILILFILGNLLVSFLNMLAL